MRDTKTRFAAAMKHAIKREEISYARREPATHPALATGWGIEVAKTSSWAKAESMYGVGVMGPLLKIRSKPKSENKRRPPLFALRGLRCVSV